MMKSGASKLYSYGRSLLPSSLSARTNCTSSISPKLNSDPNLTCKLKKSKLTTKRYGVAKEPADGKSLSRAVVSGSLGIRIDNAPVEHSVPAWGVASIIGRRRTLEDAVVAIPEFHQVPVIGDHGTSNPLSHFFGVYDGHCGSQVANYCRDRLHCALAEELEVIMATLNDTSENIREEEVWRRAFTKCFCQVDDEVGGKAPATVGSTAVVAIVCPSYIAVANCGDSRAVLKRDRESIPLSMDHKATREDEYARIVAAGGKVKLWNLGNGECGVLVKYDDDGTRYLAMSRAIGDRYWRPWVIPDPEVKIIPRTKGDRCLILASDGLWDVMTNDEVCDIASQLRGFSIESASRSVAEYLSHRAFEKSSRDNISVVVVDSESI